VNDAADVVGSTPAAFLEIPRSREHSQRQVGTFAGTLRDDSARPRFRLLEAQPGIQTNMPLNVDGPSYDWRMPHAAKEDVRPGLPDLRWRRPSSPRRSGDRRRNSKEGVVAWITGGDFRSKILATDLNIAESPDQTIALLGAMTGRKAAITSADVAVVMTQG
jgi:hypothetical protein